MAEPPAPPVASPTDHQRRRPARHIARLRDRLARMGRRAPLAGRLTGGLKQGVMTATAAILAWLPTQALGLHEGFWAAITAIAVVQTEFGATRTTARDQLTGAAIGGIVGVGTALLSGQHLWGYVLAVIASVLACWIIDVPTAARLSGITATIILLVPHRSSAERMLVSRVGEVGWGVLAAILVVGAATALARGHAARRDRRPG